MLPFFASRRKAEENKVSDNACFKFLSTCIRCCLCCCERVVKVINQFAYVEMAIWGSSFCTSACRGLSIVSGNLSYTATISAASVFLCFLIKVRACSCPRVPGRWGRGMVARL